MSGIFITYRRSDTIAWAGRLNDSLKQHFPGVDIFMDVEAIPPGSRFSDYIRDAVGSCDVLFVLIGPKWLTSIDEDGKRRLEDDDDFVSLEIKAALDRDVPVIPTLVGEATMPRKQDLPPQLQPLCDFQNFVISDRSWHDDCARLAKNIQGIVGERHAGSNGGNRSKMVIAAAACVAVLIAAFFFWYNSSVRSPDEQVEHPPPAGGSTADIPEDQTKADVSDTTATSEETTTKLTSDTTKSDDATVADVPEKNKSEVPATPEQRSILDAGLEGKWELVEIVGQGKPKDPVSIKIDRTGDAFNIFVQPGEEKWLLDVAPNEIRLISPGGEGIVNFKREYQKLPNKWSVRAVEKNNDSSIEKTIFIGWVKVSEDWHRFQGEVTPKKKDPIVISIEIEPGNRKGEIIWGKANMPNEQILKFRKR